MMPPDPPRPAGLPPPPEALRPAGTTCSVPEPLTPAALGQRLRTATFGHRVIYYPTVASTNDLALDLAAAGEAEGTLVLAEEQTGGRGRRDRSWSSGPRLGIYASLILRPVVPAPRAPLFTFMAAVAVAEALREVAGLQARIKWPNDVLVAGRKISGVLGEFRGTDNHVREMVVGIGLNVQHRREDFPVVLRDRATSVRIETDRPGDRPALLARCLEGFERRYACLLKEGPQSLLGEWQMLSAIPRGTTVAVHAPAGTTRGILQGVDEEGALLLEGPDGESLRARFGEIIEPGRPGKDRTCSS